MDHVYLMVLAGGSGTRLWPLSRQAWPKQMLSLLGERTLLQESCRRNAMTVPYDRQLVITSGSYVHLVKTQLEGLGEKTIPTVWAEPAAKNTAPAILWAAWWAKAQGGDNAVLAVMPSDHIITREAAYERNLLQAVEAASHGALVTFGMPPSHPETGYGYIRAADTVAPGLRRIERFVEKPNKATAEKYLAEGGYYWNSGMFVFHCNTLITELERLEPKWATLFRATGQGDADAVRTAFTAAPSTSIDVALMEKTDKGLMVEAGFGWSDVGSWQSLFEIGKKDDTGNVVVGHHVLIDSKNSLVYGQSRTIATIGIEDLAVIDTPDALLVCPLSETQRVREVVDRLKGSARRETLEHLTQHRPWGSYTIIEQGPGYKVKRIVVKQGAKLSLQRHFHRSEHWVVVRGTAGVVNGERELFLEENQSTYIPKTVRHRLTNPGRIPLEIIEIQSGSYLEEDDIQRYDDDYARGDA